MRVLLTGATGRVGQAILEQLEDHDEYEFTLLDRREDPDRDTVVANIDDYDAVRSAVEGHDAVVHLAAYAFTDGTWEEILQNNLIGTHNVLDAASETGVERFLFASSIHAVGTYEDDHAPELYERDFDLTVDHTAPFRPDSYYGGSKAFGEIWGKYYVEQRAYPERFYALRIASVREEPYNHPYGDAERGVDDEEWERGSEAYETQVKRLKCTWLSHRDLGQLVDRCLHDETVEFDAFYGISDNERSWFDLDHAEAVLGYDPQDRAEEWDAPPEQE